MQGPNVMVGYYRNPEETARTIRGGWLHTGDMGRLDADDFLYIVERKKDLIIRGGFNIYPREVEEALYAFPKTAEAAVIGMPDALMGEDVVAFVVLKAGEPPRPRRSRPSARPGSPGTSARSRSASSTRCPRARSARFSAKSSAGRCEEDSMADDTLARMFWTRVERGGGGPAQRFKRGGTWHTLTWREVGDIVREVALGLIALGREGRGGRHPVREPGGVGAGGLRHLLRGVPRPFRSTRPIRPT